MIHSKVIQHRMLAGTVLLAILVVSACRSTGSSQNGTSDKIAEDEVLSWSTTFSNAYDIVEQLRPQWLRKRGTISLNQSSGVVDHIVVYEDHSRLGDPESLRAIAAQDVLEIEFFSPGRAIPMGPPDHPHGAIVVWTKK